MQKNINTESPILLTWDSKRTKAFRDTLPWKLTQSQQDAVAAMKEVINKKEKLDILLSGDVGSGKTITVFMVILNALLAGRSVVLMAPTTVLAEQHYQTISQWLEQLPFSHEFEIDLITSRTRKQPQNIDSKRIWVGTQAVLFKKQFPSKVGLLVVDEQHKFGVNQRKKLLELAGQGQHIVTMTATPIPRTMALSLYGYQQTVNIKSLPKNRKAVQTKLVSNEKETDMMAWTTEQIKKKNTQVFVVYPAINESEKLQIKAAKTEFARLKKKYGTYGIELLHGQLKEGEKIDILNRFQQQKFHILVTTTVIEVGIDIPNANILIVNHPERYGLAQLHQLRGRVGRGGDQAYCFLVQNDDISPSAEERLKYFSKHHDGFKIAEYDLQRRGPGELYGVQQAGVSQLKLADIANASLMEKSHSIATKLFAKGDKLNHRFFINPSIT